MAKRKGMGQGKGKGYKNILPTDKPIHRDSGRGIKQPQWINIPFRDGNDVKGWSKAKDVNEEFQETRYDHDKSSVSLSSVFDGETWRVWIFDTFDEGGDELGEFKTQEESINAIKDFMKDNEGDF